MADPAAPRPTVLVTGAGGRTGQIVFNKLKERSDQFVARGLVRTEESKQKIGGADDVYVADIREADSVVPAVQGVDALVILTSATPKMKPGFDPSKGGRPEFYYEDGRTRNRWIGLDKRTRLILWIVCWTTKAAGVKHIVSVGSMGGTNPNHPLNSLGNGNILILDTNPQLYFHLQQQKLIELIRVGKINEALEFAQEELALRGEENQAFLEEIEKTVALLVFEDVKNCPYGELLDVSQRLKTASEVNAAILTSQSHEKDPKLPSLLKMLIWTQNQLNEKAAYPRISNFSTAALEDPAI